MLAHVKRKRGQEEAREGVTINQASKKLHACMFTHAHARASQESEKHRIILFFFLMAGGSG
jgi:hypothetical protein